MNTIYVSGYSVSGIKSFAHTMHLSFCKKTVEAQFNQKDYHIKGIYGPCGSGKTALFTSIAILKNLILHPSYLEHSIIQSKFDSIIHKAKQELYMSVDFFIHKEQTRTTYRYELCLGKDEHQRYIITKEALYVKTARSFSIPMKKVFEHDHNQFYLDPSYAHEDVNAFLNDNCHRFSSASIVALSKEMANKKYKKLPFFQVLAGVFSFALQTHVFVESLNYSFLCKEEKMQEEKQTFIKLSANQNYVKKKDYANFEKNKKQLLAYLQLFKPTLKDLVFTQKEEKDHYIIDLIMRYEDYDIKADQESRGMRKLLALYPYIQAVSQGSIVFIDDFDVYLHEVYGMALLTYLLEEAKGQLCFSSNNVAYMDVLKQSKKSIDFINEHQELHSWITNGNYSPSKLYRAKAIDGLEIVITEDDFKQVF